MSPTCQGKAAAYLVSLFAPLLRSITRGRRAYRSRIFGTRSYRALGRLLGAITRLEHHCQSSLIEADHLVFGYLGRVTLLKKGLLGTFHQYWIGRWRNGLTSRQIQWLIELILKTTSSEIGRLMEQWIEIIVALLTLDSNAKDILERDVVSLWRKLLW